MDAALRAQGPFGAKREEIASKHDAELVPAEVVRSLIGKIEDDARVSLDGKSTEPAKVDEMKATQEPEKKPASGAPTVEALQAEITALKESTQKRMDELTAQRKDAEAKAKADPNRPKTMADLTPEQLETTWLQAEQRQIGVTKDEATGETLPGDPVHNLKIKLAIEKEMRRRDAETEAQPQRTAQARDAAHAASIQGILTDPQLRKHFHKTVEKDGKNVEVFDGTMPVAKLANEKLAAWAKDESDLYNRKDAPRRALNEALAELNVGGDALIAKRAHQLELENQDLRAKLGMDRGSPGSAPTRKTAPEAVSDRDIVKERQRAFSRTTGN